MKMRKEMLAHKRDSGPVCETAFRWLADHSFIQSIAVFAALPGEPDLTELVARHPDRKWVYPKVVGEHLAFYVVEDPAMDLSPGAFGILEPTAAQPEVAIGEIDAFICPGLAFDAKGGRLGRGRGFYDRTLAMARPSAVRIGVCFENQLVPDTYSEAHDVMMNQVISA